jgi:DNA repair exonuclease SbcCD ATPase subunit
MNAPKNTPLHIVSLEIENVKRLSAVQITPDGSTVVIGGDNAQGKSSVLDAITLALEGLGGATGKNTTRPVHGDAAKGKVVLDLGEIIVTRTFTQAGGGTLTVTTAEGVKFSSPQAMLDAMLGKISFDPLAFTRQKPADQLTTLRDLCGISTALLDSARAATFEERTGVNRAVKDKEALIAGMPHHDDAPSEPVSAAAITEELKAANAKNAKRAEFIAAGKQKAQELADHQVALGKQKTEVERLKSLLGAEETRLADMERGGKLAASALDEMRAQAAAMQETDTAALTAKLDQVGALNQKLRENQQTEEANKALTALRDKAEALTAKLAEIDAKKRAKLDGAKYPVQGLALGDDGILFNGLPFSQASSAEQLRVSVGIGLASNPRLRVLLVRDGSLLDPASLAMMREMAESAEAQVWLEKVSKGSECTVIIEDGKVLEDRTK